MLEESDARRLTALERALVDADPGFARRFSRAAAALPPPAHGPVVVAVGESPSALDAVRWAALHAARTGASLRLVHVFQWAAYPDVHCLDAAADLERTARAAEVVARAARLASGVAPQCAVSTVLRTGRTGSALVAATADAGLLVLGGAAAGVRAVLGGAPSVRLLRRTRCPVAVVGRALPEGTHVAVGVEAAGRRDEELCASAREALGTAAALAAGLACAGGVRVVVGPLPDRVRQQLAPAVRAGAPDVRVEVQDAPDGVPGGLLQAGAGAAAVVVPRDLLHLGRPRRGHDGRALLHSAGCPVLVTAGRT